MQTFIERFRLPDIPAEPKHLLRLASGAENVIDLWRDGERALVGVVIDTSASATDAASFVFLAAAAPPSTELVIAAVSAAESRTRDTRKNLEIDLIDIDILVPYRTLLHASGYRIAYTMMRMVADAPEVSLNPQAPSDVPWQWADLSQRNVDLVYEVAQKAFAGIPGIFFAPLEDWRENILNKIPPSRVLLHDDEIAGYVVVNRDAHGGGSINTLARHPRYCGQGVGPILMKEALRQLALCNCRRIHLDVVTTNNRALRLYQTCGFAAEKTIPVFSLAFS